MMIFVVIVVLLILGKALSEMFKDRSYSNNSMPYILKSYKLPLKSLGIKEIDSSNDKELHIIINIRKVYYAAQNITYQIIEPIHRIMPREEHDDGEGTIKRLVTHTDDNQEITAPHCAVQLGILPTSPLEPGYGKMLKDSMASSGVADQLLEKKPTCNKEQLISLHSDMDNNSSLHHKFSSNVEVNEKENPLNLRSIYVVSNKTER